MPRVCVSSKTQTYIIQSNDSDIHTACRRQTYFVLAHWSLGNHSNLNNQEIRQSL